MIILINGYTKVEKYWNPFNSNSRYYSLNVTNNNYNYNKMNKSMKWGISNKNSPRYTNLFKTYKKNTGFYPFIMKTPKKRL